MTEWRKIAGYPNYSVSSCGAVRNDETGREMTIVTGKNGYLYVGVCRAGRPKSLPVHRLVATAFIPNPEHKREVNHLDGRKTNNRLENLEWSTSSENKRHAKNVLGKYVSPVRCVETGVVYASQREAAASVGRAFQSISACLRGKQATCGGYHWESVR